MLSNEAYAGTLWQNRWKSQEVPGKPGQKPKVKATIRPKSEQIPVVVPSIISRELFEKTQKRLEENQRLAKRNTKREYLLSGLLKHSCGSAMGGKTYYGDDPYYICYKTLKFKAPINEQGEPQTCSCKAVHTKQLEEVVWKTVTDLLNQPELMVKELERLTQPNSVTRETLEEELAQVRKRLEDIPKEERRLVEGYRRGMYADFMMREEMERIKGERAAAEERQHELERQIGHLVKAISYRGQVEEVAKRLTSGLDTMDFNERRELLRLLVDEIIYHDDGRVIIKTIIPLNGNVELHPEGQGAGG
ncbi:MAG: recombinase zinc beta ribbon domain-containing protein [Dehalococcoidia bacterium]